jgi:hypothetical protein
MSSDSVSYYDWSLSFRKNDVNQKSSGNEKKLRSVNSIGLPDDEFKDYLEKWKRNNLSE